MEQPEIPAPTPNTSSATPTSEVKIVLLHQLIPSINQHNFFKSQEILNKQRRENLRTKRENLHKPLTEEEIAYYTKQLQMLDNSIEYQRKYNENKKLENQILILGQRINSLTSIITKLQKKIDNKKRYIKSASDSNNNTKSKYLTTHNEVEKISSKLSKYEIVYASLLNKKLIEIAYVFFNKADTMIFTIPSSSKNYKVDSTAFTARDLGTTNGNIALLINYMSKTFNIPLRFPLFINGSKTVCFVNKQESNGLYRDPKDGGQQSNKIETAMKYQKENIKEIMHFLFKIGCVVKKELYDDSVYYDYERLHLFDLFINFNFLIARGGILMFLRGNTPSAFICLIYSLRLL